MKLGQILINFLTENKTKTK